MPGMVFRMNESHVGKIAQELSLRPAQVQAAAGLLEEGGTVPFIARYRKEATGLLDEVAITAIRDRLAQLAELDARRHAILKSLEERNLLTDELRGKVDAAATMATLEDVYLPFRPKRRTRATIARERGLEPLAETLLNQDPAVDPEKEAAKFVTAVDSTVAEDLKVPDVAAALQGARDIVAEKVSDDADTRAKMRELFLRKGVIRSEVIAGKEAEGAKFKDYFDWSEPLASAPSHRVLAIRRGSAEGVLAFQIRPPEEEAAGILEGRFVTGRGACAEQVRLAVKDCYKRLLALSMETEARLESKNRADADAIHVFTQNLRQLLLSSPLGQKRVLAIDPGFRTGCKTVVLDAQGRLLHHDVIYPDQGRQKTLEAEQTIKHLVEQHKIEAIAIGNGTASRETEGFIRKLGLPASVAVVMVNEAGASVYSASEAAREEFADKDITVRGAVSIGRRLMDPLAELVKIDPKSIGVGQYQHDVDQDALKKSLDDVVVSCVNGVGVEVNTASKQLLTYVSGLNAGIAENIVAYRNEHGPFKSRRELKEVPRLGEKTFEQAAGFLRVRGAENPLDESAVHPEAYPVVDRMAKDLGVTIKDLVRDDGLRQKIEKQKYVTEKIGLPTLNDILSELAKPGRDPREKFELFQFAEGVNKLEDVKPGMKLPGIVTNVTAFGAFVDVGVHQDGLVHVSQLADRFVKDPNEVVKVQQRVEVTVMEVDLARKRIALSLRKAAGKPAEKAAPARSAPVARPVSQPVAPKPRQQQPAAEGWFTAALRNAKQK
ncbi:MAG: RNA-binding transcriptional accessory protein [Phycisphaerales bacterium]|nr:RNA-binding transcriptional accessory protein [Phycisphaerales bacterium]